MKISEKGNLNKGIIQIAIDGPAGSGKGTVASMLAQKLGITYLDTGAMYRAVALYMLQNNIDVSDKAKVLENLDKANIKVNAKGAVTHIILNGVDVTGSIRTAEVSKNASKVAAISEVRDVMVKLQQNIASSQSVVMEGRDICNVVLPNANIKIFLTATLEERTNRRYNDIIKQGKTDLSKEEVMKQIEFRDYNDSHREREEDSLAIREGTTVIDSTGISPEEVVEKICELLK